MGWLVQDVRQGPGPPTGRPPGSRLAEDVAHLRDFATSRRGVEFYLEPENDGFDTTLVAVAHDGEWTRRRIGSPSRRGQAGPQPGSAGLRGRRHRLPQAHEGVEPRPPRAQAPAPLTLVRLSARARAAHSSLRIDPPRAPAAAAAWSCWPGRKPCSSNSRVVPT